jgi:hypothetical protein
VNVGAHRSVVRGLVWVCGVLAAGRDHVGGRLLRRTPIALALRVASHPSWRRGFACGRVRGERRLMPVLQQRFAPEREPRERVFRGGKVGVAGHDPNLTKHTFAFKGVRKIGTKSARFGRTSEPAVQGQAERAA